MQGILAVGADWQLAAEPAGAAADDDTGSPARAGQAVAHLDSRSADDAANHATPGEAEPVTAQPPGDQPGDKAVGA